MGGAVVGYRGEGKVVPPLAGGALGEEAVRVREEGGVCEGFLNIYVSMIRLSGDVLRRLTVLYGRVLSHFHRSSICCGLSWCSESIGTHHLSRVVVTSFNLSLANVGYMASSLCPVAFWIA